jgi:hypothetical protein
MPGMSYPHHVLMEDGTEHTVTVDQRDIAAWERQPFGCSFAIARETALVNFMRFTSWSALRRQGMIEKTMGWATFDDACVECVDEETPEEAAKLPDPTEPATSGETSST